MRLGLGRPGHVEQVGDRGDPSPAGKLQQRHLDSARRCSAWTELEASALVRRGRRFYVHAETDAIYLPYRGAVWNALGGIEHANTSPLYYFTDETGDVILLEKQAGTWSDRVYQQGRATGGRR